MNMDPDRIRAVQTRSDQLYSPQAVDEALDRIAAEITLDLGERDPLVLCVMNGGVIVTGLLLPRLGFPLRLDYVHATRYRGETRGGEIDWIRHPGKSLKGEHLLVVDDILDEGLTLEAIVESCRRDGAASVSSAVLVEKLRPRTCAYRPEYIGLQVEDRYVYGSGMDYRDYLRNTPGIWAVRDQDV